jgi:DNA-binding helix-hairpin-helix protein with protein kinase domain
MVQSRQLAQGQIVRLTGCGSTGIVGPLIGAGGQGAVYVCDVGGRRLALKWYHPNVVQQDRTLRERISRLVALGPPDERYLWPLDRAEIDGSQEFGYFMPLMSGDRRPLKDIIAAPPRRLELTLEARAAACFEVADSFQQLHAEGLCYQDINFGAFFVDPLRGSILICDADNITIDGQLGGVYGTRKFMAPEVVRREAIPSMKTDLYSMAVLFFYIIFGWHPLDGRREAEIITLDQAAERRLYGVDPLFIFDPTNDANGPVAGLHGWVVARWRAMPAALRDLFTRSFTVGLSNPEAGRVVETEWRQAFARLRDAVARCAGCGFEIPVNVETAQSPPICLACGKTVPRPTRITIGNYLVAALPGSELYRHHVEPGASVILAQPVGRIEQHPTNAEIVGLHNLSSEPWTGQLRNGNLLPVAPGRTVRVVDGLGVDFGHRRGIVAQGDQLAGDPT